ncbi:MAG: hypothetical protein L0Z50_34845 [Verrucomicrobiales bacterium]|nr:hypothetical protein [Verrucomicrobiales bacterium]
MRLFSSQCHLLADEKGVVVARPIEQSAAVDFENSRGQLAQEHPVVRDENQRGFPPREKIFEPLDCRQIQMVGRLVEEQDFRIGDERPRQEHAPLHPGGERFKSGLSRQLHLGHNPLDSLLRHPSDVVVVRDCWQPLRDNILDGPRQMLWNLLRQQRNGCTWSKRNLAARRNVSFHLHW